MGPGSSQKVSLSLQNASDYAFTTRTVVRTASPRFALSVVSGAAQELPPHSTGRSEVQVSALSSTVDAASGTYFETIELLVEAGDYSKVVRLHCLCVDVFSFVPAQGRLYACAAVDGVVVDVEGVQSDAKHASGPLQLQKFRLEPLNYTADSVVTARYFVKKCPEELNALKLADVQQAQAEVQSDARAPSASKKKKAVEDASAGESDAI